MAGRPPKQPPVEPKRPPCMSCGQPGDFEVELKIKELSLERDAGISARPYWKSDYRGGTEISTILCASCKSQHVTVTFSASAKVDHGKKVGD